MVDWQHVQCFWGWSWAQISAPIDFHFGCLPPCQCQELLEDIAPVAPPPLGNAGLPASGKSDAAAGDEIKDKAIANKRALDRDEGDKKSNKSLKPDTARDALRKPFDGDVCHLMGEEPGVLLRREQLNADFRGAAHDDGEDDEGNGDGDDGEEPVEKANTTKPKPGAKGKAKSKAKAATAKSKPGSKAKAKAKAKAKTTKGAKVKDAKVKKIDDKVNKDKTEEKKMDEEPKSKETKTFARRYLPTDPVAAARYTACRSVFEAEIAPNVAKQSSFQVGQVQNHKTKPNMFKMFPWILGVLHAGFLSLIAPTAFTGPFLQVVHARFQDWQRWVLRCQCGDCRGFAGFFLWRRGDSTLWLNFRQWVSDAFWIQKLGGHQITNNRKNAGDHSSHIPSKDPMWSSEAHRVDLVLVANNLTPWSVESILNAVYHVGWHRG